MQDSRFIIYKNKQIHYRVFGKGKVVVLIHGVPVSSTVWNMLSNSLQNNFLVIAPDLPGSGQSEMLQGENISLGDYAEVINQIIETEVLSFGEDLGEVCMIGHSMGGYITLAFAEKYPGLLNGFGLFHSSAFADDDEKKQTRLKAIDFIKTNGAYPFLKASTPNLFAGNAHLKEMEKIIEEGKKFNGEVLIQYYHAMMNRPDRTEVLKTFIKPILFIIGEHDNVIPLKTLLQQCHLPAIAHVHILENAGHMGMIEEPQRSAAIIESFLQNI